MATYHFDHNCTYCKKTSRIKYIPVDKTNIALKCTNPKCGKVILKIYAHDHWLNDWCYSVYDSQREKYLLGTNEKTVNRQTFRNWLLNRNGKWD
jgi:hypothetical protein